MILLTDAGWIVAAHLLAYWLRVEKRLEDEKEERLEKCSINVICKAKVIEQQVTIDYRWGDTLVVIKDVPAGVCQQCGERYLESGVYKEVERLAKNRSHLKGKMTVDILAYVTGRAA